ncbi:hypothetical protein F5Y15DRAFT_341935 [Xylariaceae sp. FL0016]|nr:hypothetical protein F5Y15DRAFT_341935 [Xylariaceae sp. FL0016]
MCLGFPGIISEFSAWIDLSTLIMSASPVRPDKYTGLGTALQLFGYRLGDTGLGRRHQAANDAVRTLAALDGLMNPYNLFQVKARQCTVKKFKVTANGSFFARELCRAVLYCQGKRSLPKEIDSAQKLAFFVEKYNPTGVAADFSDPRAVGKASIHACEAIQSGGRSCGHVCLRSKHALRGFVKANNGRVIGDQRVTVERAPLSRWVDEKKDSGARLRKQRQKLRLQYLKREHMGRFVDIHALFDQPEDELVEGEHTVRQGPQSRDGIQNNEDEADTLISSLEPGIRDAMTLEPCHTLAATEQIHEHATLSTNLDTSGQGTELPHTLTPAADSSAHAGLRTASKDEQLPISTLSAPVINARTSITSGDELKGLLDGQIEKVGEKPQSQNTYVRNDTLNTIESTQEAREGIEEFQQKVSQDHEEPAKINMEDNLESGVKKQRFRALAKRVFHKGTTLFKRSRTAI